MKERVLGFPSASPVSAVGGAHTSEAPEAASLVREFVRNDAADAWTLAYSWQWSDGVLTHYPFIDAGTARQVNMPAFDPGKLYRINVKYSNYLRGSVTLSLGHHKFAGYGQDAANTFRVKVARVGLGRGERLFSHNGTYSVDVVANQDGRLVFAPQLPDPMYDGAIGQVSVREITSGPAPATSVSNP